MASLFGVGVGLEVSYSVGSNWFALAFEGFEQLSRTCMGLLQDVEKYVAALPPVLDQVALASA